MARAYVVYILKKSCKNSVKTECLVIKKQLLLYITKTEFQTKYYPNKSKIQLHKARIEK